VLETKLNENRLVKDQVSRSSNCCF